MLSFSSSQSHLAPLDTLKHSRRRSLDPFARVFIYFSMMCARLIESCMKLGAEARLL